MSVQDRNMDRFAQVARDQFRALLSAPVPADTDVIADLFQPRYNFRITDLQFYATVVANEESTIRACIAKELSIVGAARFEQAAAVTFQIQAFEQLDAGVFVPTAFVAAQAFGNTARVLDGFFGAWTVQIDGSQVITTRPAANIMAFATAADALKNAPAPAALNGLVGVLIIGAVGGDFIAGTTNSNAALVDSFETIDRGGIFLDVPTLASESFIRADLSLPANNRLKVAGLGNLVGEADDLLAITMKSPNGVTYTDARATVEFRPFPLQGESAPDVASGTTGAQVP